MDYIFDTMRDYKTGLSLFYPIIYSVVVGLETKQSFEFGAGWSTRVILDAINETKGSHTSFSTDDKEIVQVNNETYEITASRWSHIKGRSPEIYKNFHINAVFDFVLHDGSHTGKVVQQDLEFILPKMKYNSVLMVHDVLHSKFGKEMRLAVANALKPYTHAMITLPYGYGLSIITILDNKKNGTVKIHRNKPTSKHITESI